MSMYFYLYRKLWMNRVKKLVRKPAALIYTIVIIAYFVWMFVMLNDWLVNSSYGTPRNLTRVLCVIALYLTPANFASYARRKGLIFLPSDVHFLFSAPVSPKWNLLYAYGKNLLLSLIVGAAIVPLGVYWFHVPLYKTLLYFIVGTVMEGILEACIVILLYGNERLGKDALRFFGWIMYAILACFVLVGVYLLYTEGFHWNVVLQYFDGEWISMIPVLGWSLAAMRLIILGPTLVNVVCTILYAVTFGVLLVMAVRMKCTGQYYEDAMKFADDYQEALKRSRKGEVAFVGRKKKYRREARVAYRGGGASAIFYRQLLEYKKERFFIFGFLTLVFLGAGLVLAWLAMSGDGSLQTGIGRYYLIPGVLMYLGFIFSSYKTRWGTELENPYVYLIPDTPFRKMWYATVIDHIRAAIHGVLFLVPVMVGLRIEWWYFPIYLLMQVCMNAVSLYASTVCSYLLGNVSDNLRRVLHMFIAWFVILLALPLAGLVTVAAGIAVGLFAGCAYLVLLAGLLAWAGSRSFAKMEQ